MANKTKQDVVVINFDSKVLSLKKRVYNAFKILFGKRIILLINQFQK